MRLVRIGLMVGFIATICSLFSGCKTPIEKEVVSVDETLTPDWAIKQYVLDKETLAVFRQNGDVHEKSREIIHFAYFDNTETGQKYEEMLLSENYNITSTSINDSHEDTAPYSITFTHNGTLVLSEISSHTIPLTKEAIELNGMYGGWEAPILSD